MEPTAAFSREEIRELDRRAIEDWGIPSFALMENAGRACADAVLELLAAGPVDAPVRIVCGPGKNGGDGLVVARTLRNRGVRAEVAFVGDLSKLEGGSDDVRLNAALWRRLGEDVRELADERAVADYAPRLSESPVVVDALFGTGLTRELTPPYSAAVDAINASGRPVVAVDLPSGLDANTGEVLGACVRATVTVTFVAPKLGFAHGRGPAHVGRVVPAEIGVPL